jgi:hypothetical protein
MYSITVSGGSLAELGQAALEAGRSLLGTPSEVAEPQAPKRTRKQAAEAPPQTGASATEAAAPAAAAPAGLSQADVRKKLQAVVAAFGNGKCSEILLKHGAPNLGSLATDKYAAVAADADAALANASDPTA